MDQPTLDFYNNNASDLVFRYNSIVSPLNSLLPILFTQGQRILDIGCGSGRDLANMVQYELDAYGLEPSENLRLQAEEHFPQLKNRIFSGGLPEVPDNIPSGFDGITLSAVIMHIPENRLFDSAFALKKLLNPGGLLVISHCPRRETGMTGDREDNGRLFVLRSSDRLQLLFEELGFQKRHLFKSNDGLGRSGIDWETLVMEYNGKSQTNSVDRIESIINHDRKTASYKLALLRALCDLAQRDTHSARWTANGRVKIPIDLIGRKWTEYYLPMMGHETFVPNNRGERENAKKPIAFRKALTKLSRFYHSSPEGIAQFLEDRDRNRFPEEANKLYQEALKKINNAIKNGPVIYSSGNSFCYNSSDRTVSMEGALWREMVLLGHWIEDSLILKWANLIHEFSLNTCEFPVNRAIELLMMQPGYERRVSTARSIYSIQDDLHCVWSGKTLTQKSLAVDHAIPFSLRHDNSLWNLQPADSKVNLNKSDKLPTSEQLNKSKDGLIHNWQILYRNQKEMFMASINRFLGVKMVSPNSWEIDLFRCFFETIELTASRRGVERWEF